VIRSRFERGIAGARARYIDATVRLERAMAAWHAAKVPVRVVDEAIPGWTAEQLAATERVAAAWAELVRRRRQWDEVLRELGHQR
jgi:hypothetical protein